MTHGLRRARVNPLAKLNLSVKVFHKRSDGYHELRTVFQTVSLTDTITVEFTPSRTTSIALESNIDLPGNLVLQAAELVMGLMKVTGRVFFRLTKRIPIGAGLGGGSSDAAAVLLTLPVLAGKRIPLDALVEAASTLGSDVPFFLLGGTAVGVGRGCEIYPLPDCRLPDTLLVCPETSVSTADAYRALGRELTSELPQNMINSFQSCIWTLGDEAPGEGCAALGDNDFEDVVFAQHPQLKAIKARLLRLGAKPAALTGSGAALYGVFQNRERFQRALTMFRKEKAFPISVVSKARYRSLWCRYLRDHIKPKTWPPQTVYAR